jgi:hypothetical protein
MAIIDGLYDKYKKLIERLLPSSLNLTDKNAKKLLKKMQFKSREIEEGIYRGTATRGPFRDCLLKVPNKKSKSTAFILFKEAGDIVVLNGSKKIQDISKDNDINQLPRGQRIKYVTDLLKEGA